MTVLSTAPAQRAVADGYTARHLTVLEGLEAVRKRPGMYIGSTDGRGLMHCLWEIVDNAVDEALAGVCTEVEVVLHADHSAEVRDNGRGIPVDVDPKTGLTGVELVMTRLHAGGKFGGGSYTASGGLHGVGASVVNALAGRLDVEVDRYGHVWAASFRRGVIGEFDGPGPDAAFVPGQGLRQVRRVAKRLTGSRIRFWPDRQVFTRDARWSFDALAQRARQTAYLVPGLVIRVRDERAAVRLTAVPAQAESGPADPGQAQAGHAAPGPAMLGAADAGLHAVADPEHGDDPAEPPACTSGGRPAAGPVPVRRRNQRVLRPPLARQPGHRSGAAGWIRPVHRDGAGTRRAGPPDPDRGRARARRRRSAALGDRLRQRDQVLRQRDRDAEGRYARRRVRARAGPDAERAAARGQAAEERR